MGNKDININAALKYLAHTGLEEQFFLHNVWHIDTYHIDPRPLITSLKEEFRQEIDSEDFFSNKDTYLAKLEAYCFEGMEAWAEFEKEYLAAEEPAA